jgi:hypothetical protein
MNARDARRFKDSPDPRVRAEAELVLGAAARRREIHAGSRAARRGRFRATRTATADLRPEALARAKGRGELCGYPLGIEPGDLCHLDGGSGKRTQEQWIGNVCIEHHRCHQGPGGLDVQPLKWLAQVKAWADRHGYPVPRRFLKLEALHQVQLPRRTT